MPFLTKSDILATRGKLKTQIIDTPEWGEGAQVIIVELTGQQRDEFEASMVVQATKRGQLPGMNMRNVRARLVAKCIVNPDNFDILEDEVVGKGSDGVYSGIHSVQRAVIKTGQVAYRMFSDIDVHDLGEVSASALDRVFDACQELSGITEKDIVELTGELKKGQSDGSGLS